MGLNLIKRNPDLKYLLSIKGLRSLGGIMYTHHKLEWVDSNF